MACEHIPTRRELVTWSAIETCAERKSAGRSPKDDQAAASELHDHGVGPVAEMRTNRPVDCGAIPDRSRTATAADVSLDGGLDAL